MSGFEGDPFGPVDNPFEDPAVREVAKQPSSVQRGLEEYNPFENTPEPPQANVVRPLSNANYNGGAQPAVMQPTQENLPAYSRNAQQTAVTSQQEFQRRQEELERKEEALKRREEELNNTYNVRRNNWPPLPNNMCGLEPCFYQDINVEIPVDFQTVVRQLYNLWLFHTILMVANVFGTAAYVAHEAKSFVQLIVAVFYLLIFTPFSFLCWYRPGYKAFRDDSSFNFMVFFFIFFFQFVICIFQAIGLSSGGTCGIITVIQIFNDGKSVGSILAGIIVLSVALGFCAAAAMDIFLLTKVHRIYRSTGASVAKARVEFTSGIINNQHVRQAASSAASAAVQSQFNQTNQPRY